METVAQVLQDTAKKVTPGMSPRHYNGLIAQSAAAIKSAVAQRIKKPTGRPARYTEQQGNLICSRISNGETLVEICNDLRLSFSTVMEWIRDHDEFAQAYKISRKSMAVNLVDTLISETAGLKSEDALAARVRSDVVKWVASKFSPEEFSDIKRIELKGEINHHHTHDLAPEQKRRIAESWLISQESETAQLPIITSETTGPDLPALEGVAVREICETEQGERPKRKRSAQVQAKPKGQRGRPRKVSVDDKVE